MTNPLRSLFESRSAISTSHELWEALSRGYRSVAGVDVTESTAMQVSAVASCVRLIAGDLASMPVDVIERLSERERRPAVNHPVRRILSQPNSWQTWPEFLAMQTAHVLLRGNGYSVIVRDSATSNGSEQIRELIPMNPDQVTVEQAPWPTLGVKYTWTPTGGGTPIPFKQSDVLHFRGLSTDGLVGRSVLRDARDTFGAALATQQHAATFWSRGGLPTVIITHPKTLGADGKARRNLEDSWAATYGGGADRRHVAVLEEGMTVQPLSVDAEDAQFLETRQFTRGESCGLFRVPPHKTANTEKSTSWGTGIEQQGIGYVTHTLLPLIVAFEHRMNRDLLINRDRFGVKFYPQALMRGDSTARGQFYWQMRQMGAFSANDVRALEDLNGIGTDGDVYLQPSNLVPLGFAPEPPKAASQGATA